MEFIQSILLFLVVLAIPKLRKAFLTPARHASTNVADASLTRLPFFDFAKGIAITAVILIHSIYLFEENFPDSNPFWLNTINNLSRFAVGFFFISSGALLTSGLTRVKIFRVFVPYALACAVVGLFQNKNLDLIIGGVFRGDLLPPYYFIPVLFQFYLLFPLLNRFKNKKYFLLITLLISYFFYYNQNLSHPLGIPFFGQYLFLFAFGQACSAYLKGSKPFSNINAWLFILPVYFGLQLMLPAHYYNSRFFYAPAMFVVLHYVWHKTKSLKKFKIVQTLGQLSLWVYLIHFSIESFLVNLIPFNFDYSVYLYIFLITILTTIASGVVANTIKQQLGFINYLVR